MLHKDIINQQIRIYKYVQSYFIILQYHVSVILVAIIKASYH